MYDPAFPSFELVQIVRVNVRREPSGLYVASSADVPDRTWLAFNTSTLAENIEVGIRAHFRDDGEDVVVTRIEGGQGDVSTWEVSQREAA